MSAPALSLDTTLNMTKTKLELILDPDMYIFFEKAIRGGVSNGCSKASNNDLKSYDPKQKWKHIIYLDANNCMVKQCLSFF